VANLAFHKAVTCRFTLDYWKTTSEIAAEYSHEVRPKETPLGLDRFTFSIKLADTANLASKTLFFCIRYSVNGQEFWDNNGSANFQVDFRKKHLPQNGKNNFQGASSRPLNGLPRSNRRRSPASPRPKSMPVAMDDFGNDPKFNFDQPIHEYLGESGPVGLRLKSKSAGNLASDNIATDLSSPSGAAFANRYDFGASLTAAVQAAKDSMGKEKDKDALYMRSNVRSTRASSSAPVTTANSHPASGTGSPNASLPSSSYEELVNKYCFFGSKQSSPEMQDGTLNSDRVPGSGMARHDGAGSQDHGHAQHHAIRLHGIEPAVNAPAYTVSPPEPRSVGRQMPAQTSFSLPATPPAGEVSYHVVHQVLPERFPWGGDSHAPAAIRGWIIPARHGHSWWLLSTSAISHHFGPVNLGPQTYCVFFGSCSIQGHSVLEQKVWFYCLLLGFCFRFTALWEYLIFEHSDTSALGGITALRQWNAAVYGWVALGTGVLIDFFLPHAALTIMALTSSWFGDF
jgi:hypothetical protein